MIMLFTKKTNHLYSDASLSPTSRGPAKTFQITVLVSMGATVLISIGNHMISSAIWDKSAGVNFSKAN